MCLTDASIIIVAAAFTLVYLTVAQADDNLVDKNDGYAASLWQDGKFSDSSSKSAHVRGKRASFLTGGGISVPGTKWCGKVIAATHDDDLGNFPEEDTCCRTHSRCTNHIAAGDTKTYYVNQNESYDISNEYTHAIFTCECDEEFKQCLVAANSEKGDEIGYLFFNVWRPQCLTYEHPLACVERIFFYWGACKRYEPDESQEKMWYLQDNTYFEIKTREKAPEITTRLNVTPLNTERSTTTGPMTDEAWSTRTSTQSPFKAIASTSVSRSKTTQGSTSQITMDGRTNKPSDSVNEATIPSVAEASTKMSKVASASVAQSKTTTAIPEPTTKGHATSRRKGKKTEKQFPKTISPIDDPKHLKHAPTPKAAIMQGWDSDACDNLTSNALSITLVLSFLFLYLL